MFKKIFVFLLLFLLCAPVFSQNSTKRQLDSLALLVLKSAEANNELRMNAYIEKMMQLGATGGSNPIILRKKTPQCPPVKIQLNGRYLSGNSCAKMGYEYNGKEYWVGYCN